MSSGIENWKICPLLTISVPIGLRRIGLWLTTGGDGVKLGDGVILGEGSVAEVVEGCTSADDDVPRMLDTAGVGVGCGIAEDLLKRELNLDETRADLVRDCAEEAAVDGVRSLVLDCIDNERDGLTVGE